MEDSNFRDHTQGKFLHPPAQSSTQERLSSFGMSEGPMSDPETHSCLSGKSDGPSCPIQIGPDTVFLQAGSRSQLLKDESSESPWSFH